MSVDFWAQNRSTAALRPTADATILKAEIGGGDRVDKVMIDSGNLRAAIMTGDGFRGDLVRGLVDFDRGEDRIRQTGPR